MSDQEILEGYGTPFYFNAGEMLVITAVAILTVTLALSLNESVSQTFASISIAGKENTLAGAWIATAIIFVFTAILFIFLFMCKRRLMRLANQHQLLHTR